MPDAASVQGGEWAGEAYEPDSTRTADAAFLKFTRRLQRCPEQCVRYGCAGSGHGRPALCQRAYSKHVAFAAPCAANRVSGLPVLRPSPDHAGCRRYGADMLWPAAERPQPQPCPRCGNPRVPELQLMPGLLAALGDGLAWQAEQEKAEAGGRATVAAPSVDSWVWLTLAVFTCKASCGQSDGWNVTEEQIVSCQEH